MPSLYAVHNVVLHSKGDNRKDPSPVAANRGDHVPYRQPNRLLELPTEILLDVFRFLLPVGQVFHFMPTTKSNYRLVSVHRLFPNDGVIPGSEKDKLNLLSTLSTVCQRLTALAYSVFFGENQFVFEIATAALTSAVRCAVPNLASWNKVIHAKPDGIAPLGNIGARYIKDLTLCVLLPCQRPTRHEWKRLENSILSIAQVFEGSGHDLRSLVVDVGLGRRAVKRVTTDRLEVSSSNGLRMQVRNIENEGGVEPQNMERLARLMALLVFMEGVKDLRLSGLLTAETMRAYKAELQKRVAEGFEDQPPAKRRKLA